MKLNKIFVVMLFIGSFSFYGCNKDESSSTSNGSTCVGGKGGKLTIITRTQHHTRSIPGCKLYLKYNTNLFPGEVTSAYDDSIQIGSDTVATQFDSLKCGKYFLYATGIDSLLDPTIWIVKGGVPFNTELDSGVINLTVYVTEGD